MLPQHSLLANSYDWAGSKPPMISSICFAITTVFFGVAASALLMIAGAARLAVDVASRVRRVSMSNLPDRGVVRVVRHRSDLEAGDTLPENRDGVPLQQHGKWRAIHELLLDLVIQRDALFRIQFAHRRFGFAGQFLVREVAAPGEDLQLALIRIVRILAPGLAVRIRI